MSPTMLFRHLCVAAVLLAPASELYAQAPHDTTSPNDLKAPAAPAFVVLDISPSKVERPQATRALVVSALSAVSSEGFPKNYAVEFAPYWLGTPTLSFKDYYSSGVRKAVIRHLSASVATTPLGTAADAGTAIGLGVRTLPLPGRPHPKLQPLLDKLHRLQERSIDEEGFFSRHARLVNLLREAGGAAVAETDETLETEPFVNLVDHMIDLDLAIKKDSIALDAIPGELEDAKKLPTSEQTAEIARLQKEQRERQKTLETNKAERITLGGRLVALVKSADVTAKVETEHAFEALLSRYDQAQKARVAKIDADLKATALAIQSLDAERVGPLLAVATAFAWDVPANDTSQASLSRVGFWTTSGYRVVRCTSETLETQKCSTPVDLLGVVRYLDKKRAGEVGSLWEFGGRVLWQARPKLAVSAEWLRRSGDDDSGSRTVGVAEYEIDDSVFLYASFGRDFEEKGVRKNLVSTIGLTFGLGKKPILDLSR